MQLHAFRRIVAWLNPVRDKAPADGATHAASSGSIFDFDSDFDPMWHGDHWQNLLSSPMDARRYVMEDWSVVTEAAFEPMSLVTHTR